MEKRAGWQPVAPLIDEMHGRGLLHDVISVNAAISTHVKHGCGYSAALLLDEMHGRGMQPDVISFDAAISTAGKHGCGH
eukprot:12173717-Karenia_brevis.AAC.1